MIGKVRYIGGDSGVSIKHKYAGEEYASLTGGEVYDCVEISSSCLRIVDNECIALDNRKGRVYSVISPMLDQANANGSHILEWEIIDDPFGLLSRLFKRLRKYEEVIGRVRYIGKDFSPHLISGEVYNCIGIEYGQLQIVDSSSRMDDEDYAEAHPNRDHHAGQYYSADKPGSIRAGDDRVGKWEIVEDPDDFLAELFERMGITEK